MQSSAKQPRHVRGLSDTGAAFVAEVLKTTSQVEWFLLRARDTALTCYCAEPRLAKLYVDKPRSFFALVEPILGRLNLHRR